MRLAVLASSVLVALPLTALAGPFSGYTAYGEMGVDFSDPTGFAPTFISQVQDGGVVGPGLECDLINPYVGGDISDTDRTLRAFINTSWGAFPFNGLRFSLTDPGAPSLEGAYIVSTNIPGFTDARVQSQGSMVSLNFQGISAAGEVILGFEDGPSLDVTGACPGTITGTFSGFTPGTAIFVARARNTGSTTIPGGPCAGAVFGLDDAALLRVVFADNNGEVTLTGPVGNAPCGAYVQALDFETCRVTEVAQIP